MALCQYTGVIVEPLEVIIVADQGDGRNVRTHTRTPWTIPPMIASLMVSCGRAARASQETIGWTS